MNKIIFLFWNILIGVSHAGDYCYFDSFEYCEYGCCTTACCKDDCCEYEFHVWLVFAIIGGVIGAILLVSFVICIICVVVKQNGKPGRVIQPDQSTVQPPPYTTAVAYTVVPRPQPAFEHELQYPVPAFSPSINIQNHTRHPTTAVSEGLHNDPLASGSLPGNHQVV